MATVPQSVLVAVDFSEAAARAVALGGFIAGGCGAALRLLHAEAADAPAYFTSAQIERLEDEQRAARTHAEHALSMFGRQHTHEPFSSVVEGRPPVEAILREMRGVGLVVMGTHARSGLQRWWLGSVAERVLHEIDRPLLIVHADASEAAGPLFARVLVHASAPVTGTPTLDYARALTTCFKGEVVDGRLGGLAAAAASIQPTLLVVAMPQPRTAPWFATHGEPLVRHSNVPVLFVPEVSQGAV